MMRTGNGGQATIEYFVSYGWAILAVMTIGIALWKIGIFNPGATPPPTYTGFSKLKPLTMHSGGIIPFLSECATAIDCPTLTLAVSNGAGLHAEITEVHARTNPGGACTQTYIVDSSDASNRECSCDIFDQIDGNVICSWSAYTRCDIGGEIPCATPVTVRKGENIQFCATECGISPAEAKDNIEYTVDFEIHYATQLGDVATNHVEYGTLRGTFE